jgi:hypothetical protein
MTTALAFGFVGALVTLPVLAAAQDPSHPAMAAASGVARADGGKGPADPRVIPLRPMAGDVELLYGDPDVEGQTFVMRILELPGATSTSLSSVAPGTSPSAPSSARRRSRS